MIRKMGMEYLLGLQETFIKVITKLTSGTATGRCIGVMEASTKGNGKMEYSMAMVYSFIINRINICSRIRPKERSLRGKRSHSYRVIVIYLCQRHRRQPAKE